MIKLLQNITGQKLLLPFYHELAEKEPPHLKGLYHVRTPQQFEHELDFYLKHYKPITLNKLVEHIYNDVPVEEPSFIVSFDDGLRGVYDYALPILKRKGLEAMLFVNPPFIDNKDMMFRLKVSLLANELKKPNNKEHKYVSKYLFHLKQEHGEHINELAKQLDYHFEEYLKTHQPYLSLEQLKELEKNGFHIGGHTNTHPELRYLPLDEQVSETLNSMDWVKQNLNPQHQIFSFPFTDFGISEEFYKRTEKQIDIYFGGAGLKTESNPKHLQRIPIENFNDAKDMIYYQYIYWLLKMPLGKNHIKRN